MHGEGAFDDADHHEANDLADVAVNIPHEANDLAEDARKPDLPLIEVDANDGDIGTDTLDDHVNKDNPDSLDADAQMDTKYGRRTGTHDFRARKPRDYDHLHITPLESIAMTQQGIQKGLKRFGEAGVVAISRELVQLHEREVEPKYILILEADNMSIVKWLMPPLQFFRTWRVTTVDQ